MLSARQIKQLSDYESLLNLALFITKHTFIIYYDKMVSN